MTAVHPETGVAMPVMVPLLATMRPAVAQRARAVTVAGEPPELVAASRSVHTDVVAPGTCACLPASTVTPAASVSDSVTVP